MHTISRVGLSDFQIEIERPELGSSDGRRARAPLPRACSSSALIVPSPGLAARHADSDPMSQSSAAA